MLVFNELRIDEENRLNNDTGKRELTKCLIVDASYIDENLPGITDDPNKIADVYVGIGSNTDVIAWTDTDILADTSHTYFTRLYTTGEAPNLLLKGFRLVYPLHGDDAKQLIYVKVAIDNTLGLLDCNAETEIEGYVYDKCLLMNSVFDYIKESNTPCSDVTGLANYIAKIKGLELAVEGGNFNLANKYWNKFFMNNSTGVSSNCCCR